MRVSRTLLATLALVVAGVVAGVGRADGSAAQSPEGVVVARDGDLFAVSLASGTEVRLTTTRAWESAPAVSPDGQTILYERAPERSKEPTLWKMQFDGSRQSSLGVSGGSPAWTPDGTAIYFARSFFAAEGICANLWRTSATGRGTVRVTRSDELDANPAVSPDGRILAFEAGDCEPGIPEGLFQIRLATGKWRVFPRLPRTSTAASIHRGLPTVCTSRSTLDASTRRGCTWFEPMALTRGRSPALDSMQARRSGLLTADSSR